MSGVPAVFLDRDGTLIHDSGFLSDPAGVRLLPGAADAVAKLNRAGLPAIVVTNQSGIARGLLDEAAYDAVRRRLDALLETAGAHVHAHYHCPHHPDLTGPCECRKPGPLLYRRAAEAHGIDLAASWWIGDRIRDVVPAEHFGGSGVLVGVTERLPPGSRFDAAPDLAAAVDRILASHYFQPP